MSRERTAVVGVVLLASLLVVPLLARMTGLLGRDRYSARVLLQVMREDPRVMPGPPREPVREQDYRDYQTTQEMFLRSRMVLHSALRRPEVARLPVILGQADPASWLADKLEIEFEGEVMSIALKGGNPSELVTLVNSVVDAYLSEVVDMERNSRIGRYNALDKLHATYQEDSKKRRAALEQVARTNGASEEDRAVQRRILESRLAVLACDQASAESERIRLEAEREVQKAHLSAEESKSLDERIAVLQQAERSYAERIDAIQKQARTTDSNALDLQSVRNQIAVAEEVAQRIGREVEQLKIELEAPPRIRILEKAEVATPL